MTSRAELMRRLVEALARAGQAAEVATKPYYTSLDGQTRIDLRSVSEGTTAAVEWFAQAQQILAELRQVERKN